MNKLKKKWGIKSNVQLFIILLVFSITGFLAGFIIADPLLLLLDIKDNNSYYWPRLNSVLDGLIDWNWDASV